MRRILLSILFCSAIAAADEVGVQFEQANQLYRNGEYQKAAGLYEQILLNGYENTVLHFNLGNTYFKLRRWPAAILSYERAKRLAPNDEDISYNLHLANLNVVDKIEPIPKLFLVEWWNGLTNFYSADAWSRIALGCLWVLAAAGALFLTLRSNVVRRMTGFGIVLALVVCLFSFTAVLQRLSVEQNQEYGIVFSPSAAVKSAPDEQSTDLFVIHEGVKVQLVDTVNDWKKVRLADGKVGWLVSGSIQVI